MKQNLKAYFGFSKKEYNGMLILFSLIVAILLFPSLYSVFQKDVTFDFETFEKEIAHFKTPSSKLTNDINNGVGIVKTTASPTYFTFDPNNLPVEKWSQLGLSDRQINMIKKYESKGGRFYRKEDLQKIYSITPQQYSKLAPYIVINVAKNERVYATTYNKQSAAKFPLININQADSATLETIRGIGPAFASRIVKYRNRLGGFHSTTQLCEVYGIDSARYAQLESQIEVQGAIQKININTCTFDQLKQHPYLSYKQMHVLLNYRKQHGDYTDLNSLKNIRVIDSKTLSRIAPYISY